MRVGVRLVGVLALVALKLLGPGAGVAFADHGDLRDRWGSGAWEASGAFHPNDYGSPTGTARLAITAREDSDPIGRGLFIVYCTDAAESTWWGYVIEDQTLVDVATVDDEGGVATYTLQGDYDCSAPATAGFRTPRPDNPTGGYGLVNVTFESWPSTWSFENQGYCCRSWYADQTAGAVNHAWETGDYSLWVGAVGGDDGTQEPSEEPNAANPQKVVLTGDSLDVLVTGQQLMLLLLAALVVSSLVSRA